MTRDLRTRDGGGQDEGGGGASGGAPGKATRTQAIQRQTAGGAPLPDGVRERFEGSLGADLGAVRVHTGADSAAEAQALDAQAFTVGDDIHFGAGRFQPDDPFGLHLLAHEVAHTQQQAGGSAGAQRKPLEISQPGDAAEQEADRAAAAMVRGAPATVGPASPAVQRWFGFGWGDDEEKAEADASKYAATPVEKKPPYLASYLSGRQFPWDLLQPDAKAKKALTAKIIQDWIDFYGLSVHGRPAPDRTKDCIFNGGTTHVDAVVSLFMKEAKLAGFRDDPYGAYEIISRDQQAKYRASEENWNQHHGKGGGAAGGVPHKPGTGHDAKGHDNHVALEWEFTPLTAKKTWGGEDEVEGPKHQLKGVLHAKVWEIGASWKAEVSGSAVVELEHGKPAKVGTEVEGKLSKEFIAELLELEVVAKVLAANEAKLKRGETVNGRMQSPPVHVTPGVDVNVVYSIPGTKGLLQVKGGVSADPEGVSLGAAFSVSWK